MEDGRNHVNDLVLALRKNPFAPVRCAAAVALGEFGKEAASAPEALGFASGDSDEGVRRDARTAVDRIRSAIDGTQPRVSTGPPQP
jgi:hypothetical protein